MDASLTPSLINRRYQLQELLGEGGMGSVHKALDRLTGKTLALKQVKAFATERGFDAVEIRLALAQEFKVLASLRHPHIISVLDYGFNEDNMPFVTMELLENSKELTDACAGKPTAFQVEMLVQVLQALAYLHRRGILHRDLKPGNVLVTADDEVKVLDFGLAAEPEQAKEIAGTLSYMAPEVIVGEPPSPAADLYAVGIMAYEMFIGHAPFESKSQAAMINDILMSIPDLSDLDEQPAMQAVISRLLSKTVEDRYYDAYEVIEELCYAADIVQPEESQAIRESFLQAAKFVGREAELESLENALEAAKNNTGSAWLISGESGVGKSRLLDELRVQALVQGVSVLRGQASSQQGIPYQMWREPLRYLMLNTEMNYLDAGILKDIIYDIGNLLERAVDDPIELEGEDYQKRLVGTIINIFRKQKDPILLMLEDLQWTAESREVLKTLVDSIKDLPILVVGSYKLEEEPHLHETLPTMQLMKLERLPPESVQQLSRSMLGASGQNEELLALLQRETEGNVFFLVEVMRELAEQAGRLGEISTHSLPKKVLAGGVQNVIRLRLARVPEEFQPLLTKAALLGREFDMQVLERLKEDTDLDAWLTACANFAVLEIQDGDWRFAHDKLREVAVGDIPEDQKQSLHQQVAEAIEAVHPDDPDQSKELAYHWREAGNINKEYKYAQQAGETALRISSFTEAINHLQRVLDVLPDVEDIQQADKTSIQIDLLSKLGVSMEHIGRYAEATQFIEQSLEISRAENDTKGIARALNLLGDTHWRTADYDKAKVFCEESLELARSIDDKEQVARALNRLGIVALDQGDYEQAENRLIESLAVSREIKDYDGITGVTNNLGIVALTNGNYEDAVKYYEESLKLSQESGQLWRSAITLLNLGTVAGEQGDLETAVRYFEESMTASRSIGDQVHVSMALGNLGFAAQLEEDYTQAYFHYQESLEISRSIGNHQGSADTLVNLGLLAKSQQDYEYALEMFTDALELAREISRVPTMMQVVVGIAEVSPHTDRAPVWLSFVLNYPATSEYYRQEATRVLEGFKESLSDEDYQQALESGKSLDIDSCIDEVLELHREPKADDAD